MFTSFLASLELIARVLVAAFADDFLELLAGIVVYSFMFMSIGTDRNG